MAGINNNLYPPIFNRAYMPAFVRETGCRVYFSISSYNSLDELHHSNSDRTQVDGVQVVVQNQKTNQSVLASQTYPSGVKLTNLHIDSERQGNDIYYIDIFNSDIQGGFTLNQYYKVQVRFTAEGVALPANNKMDGWLSSNLAFFSEWSTVVLIRPISSPTLVLNNFDQSSDLTTFTLKDIVFAGRITFDNKDQETLQKYRIKIYNQSEELLEDSGDVFLNTFSNTNQIYYRCRYNFSDNVKYILGIQILTENLYSWPEEKRYVFNIDPIYYTVFDADITARAEDSAGRIAINLQKSAFFDLGVNIIIRRSSSKDNFMFWEDLYTFFFPANAILNYTWYDYTVENGVWYSYRAYLKNKEGYHSTSVQIPTPVMLMSEDIFLTANNRQLKIRFDPQVSNFSHSISESLTETIGSQYPFIRRNGNVNYRTFSLSGTITHFMDIKQNLMRSSREDIYSTALPLYNRYNQRNNINAFNDVIYEKDFRQQVMNFLYENNVKLYKSATEGNILVKLMDISFTPNTILNRQIYSFTCTAYEVDDFNYENCIKYNIQKQGSYQFQTNYLFSILGQIERPIQSIYYKETGEEYDKRKYGKLQYFGDKDIVKNILVDKYQKFSTNTLSVSIDYLSYLRVELTSPPRLIKKDANNRPVELASYQNWSNAICLGHIAVVNGEYIIIGKDGIYELSDPDTKVTSFRLVSSQQTGMISYEAVLSQDEKEQTTPKQYSVFSKVGQYWGFFNLQDSIFRKIVNKYNQSYTVGENSTSSSLFSQQLQTINSLRIQADPGTVFYLKDTRDVGLQRHVIGKTGSLDFNDDDTVIYGLYFVGPHLKPVINDNYPQDDEFVETNLVYGDFEEVKSPIKNGVYTIINKESNPNINLLSTQGLDITLENLRTLAALVATNISQDSFKETNRKMNEWLNSNDSYYNNLSYQEKQLFIDLVYQAILKQYINSGNRYIYYKGGWYAFTENNDVVISSVEAIIDYYCTILRKRY